MFIILIATLLLVCFESIPEEKDAIEFISTKELLEKPDVQLGEKIGVSTHEHSSPVDFARMKNYGFSIARDDLVWSYTETEKGKYDFTDNKELNYDLFIQKYEENDIRPYLILLYTNELYNDNMALDNDYIKKAYSNWAEEAVKRYKNKNVIWEIYNEPNASFWEPQTDSAKHYTDVVKMTAPKIRRNDPSGVVVAPALAGLNDTSLGWLNQTFEYGLLDYIDAISVHPYMNTNPEKVIDFYGYLRDILKKYDKEELPIISGEWGYSTALNPNGEHRNHIASSELEQAQYLSRMIMINDLMNIKVSIVYDWKDDGEELTTVEHNFGIMHYDQTKPKLSGIALNVLTNTLGNYKLDERINLSSEDDYLLRYKSGNKNAYAFWTTGETHTIQLQEKVNGKLVTMLGNESSVEGNGLSLEISKSPTYIVEQ
nr:cellulase family glycosylhydrolase [Terribacillus saccharophilus]